MYSRIKSQTPLTVVTLTQAKAQLNIVDNDADNDHINLLIEVATERAQDYTNRLLSVGVVELITNGVRQLYLPKGQVEEVTTAQVTSDQTNVDFTFEPISQILTFDDNVDVNQNITITYSAGYVTPPKSAVMGVLMILASLDLNREDESSGGSISNISLNSENLLNSIRIRPV